MAGCFTDDLLGDSGPPRPAFGAGGFDFAAAEAAFSGVAPGLFEQLKAELKDTFLSYLTASMPESLLRKYQPDELIRCLQILLQELRKCIASNGLQDVHDEEPTSIAEALRQASPQGWLDQLQGAAAWTLRSKHDVSELIDTLQSLAGSCSDRLNDEIGPISMWCPADSPLRKMPELPPKPISPEHADTGGLNSTWNSALAPAPWAGEAQPPPTASRPPGTAMRPPPTATLGRSPSPATPLVSSSSAGHGPAPVFNAALGPASWEQETFGVPQIAGPGTAQRSRAPATAGRLGTSGPRPPMMSSTGVGWSSGAGGASNMGR